MDAVKDISFAPINDSKYIKPLRIHYTQNGLRKNWDVMNNHESVAILIHNVSRDVLVFVRQFRPAVYISIADVVDQGNTMTIDERKYPPSLGITYELCAGIVDKDKPLVQIAQEEVLEETGYNAPVQSFEKVTSFRGGVGVSGALANIYYVPVTDDMKVSKGGGNPEEGELIELTEVPAADCLKIALDESIPRPAGLSFAMFWFHHSKLSKA